jgi:pimeloyl-ACP methyl ester carboxylesterase
LSSTSSSRSVRSADGTRIAFDRTGDGPALILVAPALRAYGALGQLLAERFTVITYDRRGRGDSTDTAPYAPEREVEDLQALIAATGGSVRLYGYSAGALLALHAAANGLPVERIAVFEPPLQDDHAERPDPLTRKLTELIEAGRREDALEHFHRSIGVPTEYIAGMRATPDWPSKVEEAHTLVYDCALSDATTSSLVRAVEAPTLVLDSAASSDDLTGWAAGVAKLLPRGSHRSLPGEWHAVPDEVLAPVLVEFLLG